MQLSCPDRLGKFVDLKKETLCSDFAQIKCLIASSRRSMQPKILVCWSKCLKIYFGTDLPHRMNGVEIY